MATPPVYPVPTPSPDPRTPLLTRVQAAIEEIRAGRMVILVDDEDRENEGDLAMAAEAITPEAVNFMARYGRGLICLTLTPPQVDRLQLPMMQVPGRRGPTLGTAFTMSIEARYGVTTGISTADRAHTIRVAADPNARSEDIVSPGHVFPLRARSGGVLVRAGQTEGSVDLARLAGLTPAGVICEIMNDDGTMARMPDLEVFASEHGIRILTIADLIAYRLQTETIVRRITEAEILLERTHSCWRAVVYEDIVEQHQMLALVKGRPAEMDAVLCRVHQGSSLADAFGVPVSGRTRLSAAIDAIEREGVGVIVYLPPSSDLCAEVTAVGGRDREEHSAPFAAAPVQPLGPLRDYGFGAQVLRELGVRRLRLLTNHPTRMVGLVGHGLEVVERMALDQSG
ncbi:MAG: 3,4-dihydroxy-2-butanone-4-phosphate synthase [Polyangiaceae bacterium]|nr:3,4-dihydroxy-2-butanone-4-phosphate synthase [Polyangiaceae bacterium]